MISAARIDAQFGSTRTGKCYISKNTTVVLNSKCGRSFFESKMTSEEALSVPRDICSVKAINPHARTVRFMLGMLGSQFGLKKGKDAPWTSHISGAVVELGLGDILRHEKAWSETKGDYVIVPPERKFQITLVSVDPPRQSSSTPLLDQLLGSGQLQIASGAGGAAASDEPPSYHEQKREYDEQSELAKKRVADYKHQKRLAEKSKANLKTDKALQVAYEDLVGTFRALLRMRPSLPSEMVPPTDRLMRRLRAIKLEQRNKLENGAALDGCAADNERPYTSEELRKIAPDVKRTAERKSNSAEYIKTMMKKCEKGGGLQLTSVQKELVRVHITEEEDFSVEKFIRGFSPDERHRNVWSHSNGDHVDAVQEWNESILKELELYEEVRLYLALVRAMLLEPTEKREQMDGETKADYKIYLSNFREDVIPVERRSYLEKEEVDLKADILKRKADLEKHVSETFATHRLQSGFFGLVNFEPDNVFKDSMFTAAVCVAYDATTGVTTFQGHEDSSKIVHLTLCDYRVRFSPKYAPRKKVEESELDKHRKRLSLHMHWSKIQKEYRSKHKATHQLCKTIRKKGGGRCV